MISQHSNFIKYFSILNSKLIRNSGNFQVNHVEKTQKKDSIG